MPGRPPKKWFKKMEDEIKNGNPDYSQEQVDKTVGDIWHHELSESKKDEIIKRYESMRTTALDRNVFQPVHEDFKDSIKSRVMQELTEAYEGNALQDFGSFYEKTYQEVVDYVIPLYMQAIKDELTQASIKIKNEVKDELQKEGFEKVTSSANEKDALIKSIKANATTLFLYSTLKRLIRSSKSLDEFQKVSMQLSQEDLNSIMEILKSMQTTPQNTQKQPMTQKEVEDLIQPLQQMQQQKQGEEGYDVTTKCAKVTK